MYVRQRRKRIETWTPAKLNLFLEVLSRRADGFHEIETLMVPVSLCDTLTVRAADIVDPSAASSQSSRTSTQLTARWAPGLTLDLAARTALPPTEDNLVYRAVERLRQASEHRMGRQMPPVHLELCKRIPSEAGLGGGSSDAAAALVAANLWWKAGWSRSQLAEIASQLGSDVPFFLYGTAAICRGRGELVEPLPPLRRPLHFVIVKPTAGLSTAAVYQETQLPSAPHRVDDWMARQLSGTKTLGLPRMFNRLQQPAFKVAPWLEEIRREFARLQLPAHQLSGSGSSYFGVCRNRKQALQAAARLRARGRGQAFAVQSLSGTVPAIAQPSHN